MEGLTSRCIIPKKFRQKEFTNAKAMTHFELIFTFDEHCFRIFPSRPSTCPLINSLDVVEFHRPSLFHATPLAK